MSIKYVENTWLQVGLPSAHYHLPLRLLVLRLEHVAYEVPVLYLSCDR